ncbi:Xaa-Pro dipeptidyl-peptidase [Demetria terragena]|uniref:Xaa-Pro dipeptidyl-peptidase n=1 Tax=Demetria terragena TaxID=63959 RepID=UPI00035E7E71|nr:Xaa-Pro dipeptidyl-peptidase [Demetria terragena]
MTPRSAPGRTLATLVCMGLMTPALIAASAAPESDGPVFKDGLSQDVFDKDATTWERQEFWVEGRSDSDGDGRPDRIHVSLARPKESRDAGVKVPIILQDSPYFAGLAEAENWSVDHPLGQPPKSRIKTPVFKPGNTTPIISKSFESRWVTRGFAVAQMESPGSGLSDGCATTGDRNETLAAKAVIEWFAGKGKAYSEQRGGERLKKPAWTTGRVGMTGTSYNGTLPIAAASAGVANLEAIVPDAAISSWYGYYRSQGAVRAPGGFQGEDADVLADAVTTRKNPEVCQGVLSSLAKKQDRVTGDYTRFWKDRNYLEDAHKFHTPALISHGLNDRNVMPDQAVNLYRELGKQGVPRQIYLHQGGHGGPPTDELMNRWFSRYLWNHRNGVEKQPQTYVVNGQRQLERHRTWPVPGSGSVRLKASGDGNAIGMLNRKGTSAGKAKGSQTVTDNAAITVADLAKATTSPHRLAFATDALPSDVLVTGSPSARIRASFDAKRANLTAALVEYLPDGTARVISRGWADPRNASSVSREKELKRGKDVTVDVKLQPIHTTVKAGSKLGLVVLQGDQEFTVRPAAGATMKVAVQDTSIEIPVARTDKGDLK